MIDLYIRPSEPIIRSLLQVERVMFVCLGCRSGHQSIEDRGIVFDSRTIQPYVQVITIARTFDIRVVYRIKKIYNLLLKNLVTCPLIKKQKIWFPNDVHGLQKSNQPHAKIPERPQKNW